MTEFMHQLGNKEACVQQYQVTGREDAFGLSEKIVCIVH